MEQERTILRTHETRAEELRADIDKKLAIINQLRRIVETADPDERSGQIRDHFREFLADSLAAYPQAEQKVAAIASTLRRFREVQKKRQAIQDSLDTEAAEEFFTLQEEEEALRGKIEEMRDGGDVSFLMALYSGIDVLVEKNKLIAELKDRPEELSARLSKLIFPQGDRQFDPSHISSIYKEAFDVMVIVSDEYFRSFPYVEKGTKGRHLPDTPFSLVRQQQEQSKEKIIMKHEKIHNLLEGFVSAPEINPYEYVRQHYDTLEKLERMKKEGMLNERMGLEEMQKQRILALRALPIIDSLHHEFLADLDGIEEHIVVPSRTFLPLEDRPFTGLNTVARQQEKVVGFLEEQANARDDLEIAEATALLAIDVDGALEKAKYRLREALFIGQRTACQEEVEALAALIKPSEFRKLERYLKARLGQETFQLYAAIYSFCVRETLSRKELQGLLAVKDQVTEEDKALVKEKCRRILDGDEDFYGTPVASLEELGDYIDELEKLFNVFEIEKEAQDEIFEILMALAKELPDG